MGGGLYFDEGFSKVDTVVRNTVLWNNKAPAGPEIYLQYQFSSGKFKIEYSDVEGGRSKVVADRSWKITWGPNVFDKYPHFTDSENIYKNLMKKLMKMYL